MPVYKSIYEGPPRGYGSNKTHKKYIAIHNTSNNAPAVNEASYAKRRPDSVSSHYYVDDERIIQSLNTDLRAWHAGSTQGNSYAISYEFVGTNSKSRDWWLNNIDWDKAAKQIAADMKHFGIANRHLTSDQMRSGATGIVTHDQMSRVWGGSDHNDPGPNFPMDHLIKKINQYLNPVPAKPEPSPPKEEEDMTPTESAQLGYVDGRLLALATGTDKVRSDLRGGGQEVWLVKKVKELDAKVDKLIALLEAQNKTS